MNIDELQKRCRHLEEENKKHKDEIIDYGIDVIQIKQNRYNFMIVDQTVVWYGDISILGGSYGEGSMIRIQNELLANELMGAIIDLNEQQKV